jgi:hypothetical protein
VPAPSFNPVQDWQLRALPIQVFVPAELPEDFQVQSVLAEDSPDWGASYQIVFEGPEGAELTVQGTVSGVGDIFRGQSRQKFENTWLGQGVMEFYEPESEEPVDFRTHWLQVGSEGPFHSLSGKGLEPKQALHLAENLAPRQ